LLLGYQYKENAQEIFEKFFGTANPFAAFGSAEAMPFAKKLAKPGPKKLDPVLIDLDCSLAELYNGCLKKVEITRKRFDAEGIMFDDFKQLSINVKAGWKKGTKVTFPNEGDEALGCLPADVIFVIQENNRDTPAFVRDGNNLIYTHKLPLSDALTDCSLIIPTLDGRLVSLACPEVVSPYYEKFIPGEGMPISKKPGQKGDMVIKFHILFPKYLNGVKRIKIKELLANEELLN
jgi:DnaJ-class molecular chaperone